MNFWIIEDRKLYQLFACKGKMKKVLYAEYPSDMDAWNQKNNMEKYERSQAYRKANQTTRRSK